MLLSVPTGVRLIVFDDPPGALRGHLFTAPAPLFPAKDPMEDLNFGLDFRRVIEGRQSIVQIDVDVLPIGAVCLVEARWVGTVVIVRVAGGVDQTSAEIAVGIVLASGETLRRSAILPISTRNKLAPLPIPGAVLTLNGAVLEIGEFIIPDGS